MESNDSRYTSMEDDEQETQEDKEEMTEGAS